jgi:hypothetical protein
MDGDASTRVFSPPDPPDVQSIPLKGNSANVEHFFKQRKIFVESIPKRYRYRE